MGIELGDMWVRYRADVSDLASKMGQAKSSMSSANDSAQSAGSGITAAFSNAGSSLLDFGAKVGMAMNGLQTLGQGAVSLAENLLGPAAASETMGTAFTTLLGSTKAANDEMQKLDQFASKTPFTTMDIDKAASQLVGFGASATDVVPDLTAIGDALSAVGRGSAANLDSVVNVFGKIQTEGKLSVGTMQELSVNGVNAWSVLEKQTGKTKDQLTTMIQAGLFPAKDAISDLTKGIEANPLYTGGMAKQSGTMQGLVSTLKSNWDQMLTSFGSPILKGLEPIIGGLGNALSSPGFKSFAGSVGQGIVNAFTDIGNGAHYVQEVLATVNTSDFGQAMKDIGVEARQVGEWLKQLGAAIHPVAVDFDPLADVIQKLAQGGLNTLSTLLWNVSAAFNIVNTTVQGGTTPLSGIGAIFKQIGPTIQSVGSALSGDFNNALQFASSLFTAIQPGIQQTQAILGGQLKTDLQFVGHLFQQVGSWIQSDLLPAFATLKPPIISIAGTISTDLFPAMATLMATGHQIAEAVLPPLIGAFERVSPPIIKIAGWLGGGLAIGFKLVGPLLLGLANGLSGLVNFFTKTEIGGDLLKAALIAMAIPLGILTVGFIALGVQAIVGFVVAIPGMIAGFIAGAAGAWSMAAGVIALTWPILAVIAVIALIILAVQHWGQIASVLQNAWSGIAGFFGMLWGKISGFFGGVGKWFHDRFTEAYTSVTSAFGHVGQFIMGLWNNEVHGWEIIGQWFHDRFTDAWNAVTGVFSHVGGFLIDQWNNEIHGWQIIGSWFHDRFTEAWNNITGIFSHIGSFLMDQWNNEIHGWEIIGSWFHDRFTDAWNQVTSIFGNVGHWFDDRWHDIQNAFSGVKNFFAGIGSDIWNGIKSGLNWVIGGINDFINFVDRIHISIPAVDMGPVHTPAISLGLPYIPTIPLLAKGGSIAPGQWGIAGDPGPHSELIYGGTSGASVFSHGQSSNMISAAVMAALASIPAAGRSSGDIHVHNEIYLDERKMTDIIMNRVVKTIRIQSGAMLNI